MESSVYLCNKKKRLGRYYIELQENREIKASGYNIEDCKEEIAIQIMDWNGDMQAVVEFIPEKSIQMKTGVSLYSSLEDNEGIHILNGKELYVSRCPKCLYPLGDRNDVSINIETKPKGAMASSMGRFSITFYKKSLVDLFSAEEKKLFDIKPILVKGVVSDYLELIPKKIITHSGHIGAEYPTTFTESWRCSECGREEFLVEALSYKYNYEHIFVDPKTIRNNPTMFFLRHGMHLSLTVRNDRWIELLKHKKETKGITISPVVVLEEKYVEYPELEEPEKFEW